MDCFYKNAQIFHNGTLLWDHAIYVKDGKICDLIPQAQIPTDAKIINLDGGIITPGYVETQANGGGGVLFNDSPCIETLQTMLQAHRTYGTVAMLPTFITDSPEKMQQAMKAIAQGLEQNIQGLVGGHFEGPFLSKEKKGTHVAEFIRQFEESDLHLFSSHKLGRSLVTLAPEHVPEKFIQALAKAGFRICAGHTMAQKKHMVLAHNHGLTGVTHLYNAMPPLTGREPSVIGSAIALGLYCGIIVDGVHSDPFSLRSAYKSVGANRLMLVTDSMHTIGMKEEDLQEFMLTGQKVFVQDGVLRNEHGALAGAHITMEQSVKNAISLMGATIEDALKMAVSTPAKFLDYLQLSQITGRKISDVLWLDDSLNVHFLQELS